MKRQSRVQADADMDEAEQLLVLVLGGVVAPGGPCEYPECRAGGVLCRNGRWCRKHERKMERVPRGR